MDKEKQIREMARDLCGTNICPKEIRAECIGIGDCDQSKDVAKSLYNAGYRKQSEGEWIRYPYNSGIYCSLCKHKRRYRDIKDAYCPNCGARMSGGKNE